MVAISLKGCSGCNSLACEKPESNIYFFKDEIRGMQVWIEIAIVLMVGQIRVPSYWADYFFSALIGSVPAFARLGLVWWLVFFLGGGWLLLNVGPPVGEKMQRWIEFAMSHPTLGLSLGPLFTLWIYCESDTLGLYNKEESGEK